jgi:hypothetical protein
VTYGLALWPGVYEVELAANAALCGQGLAAPPVPCIGGAVRSAVRVEADGVLDVDLPAVTVSGTVRLNGAPLPAESAGRGSIGFARSSAEGGGMASVSLGPSGSATYAVTLLPGRYLIRHQANAALCAPAAATPGVPCASQVVFGCTSAP